MDPDSEWGRFNAQQVVPFIGWLLVTMRLPQSGRLLWLATALYLALIAFTFVQALQGRPFIA